MQRVRAPKPPNPRATHQLVARRQTARTRSRRDVSAMRMTIAAAITSEEVMRVEDRMISLGDNLGSQSYPKEPEKDQAAGGVPELYSHRQRRRPSRRASSLEF